MVHESAALLPPHNPDELPPDSEIVDAEIADEPNVGAEGSSDAPGTVVDLYEGPTNAGNAGEADEVVDGEIIDDETYARLKTERAAEDREWQAQEAERKQRNVGRVATQASGFFDIPLNGEGNWLGEALARDVARMASAPETTQPKTREASPEAYETAAKVVRAALAKTEEHSSSSLRSLTKTLEVLERKGIDGSEQAADIVKITKVVANLRNRLQENEHREPTAEDVIARYRDLYAKAQKDGKPQTKLDGLRRRTELASRLMGSRSSGSPDIFGNR